MRMMMKVQMDTEAANQAIADASLPQLMEKAMERLQPESAYFGPEDGVRTAFIVFDPEGSPPTRWEIAHELMHAFQYSYRYKGDCASYNDWDEAVATWAGQYLYPRDDEEHTFRWLLRDPENSLADASYEGWVFPYAMEQLHGAGTIDQVNVWLVDGANARNCSRLDLTFFPVAESLFDFRKRFFQRHVAGD